MADQESEWYQFVSERPIDCACCILSVRVEVHESNGLNDEKEKSVSVDGDVNFEQFDNGGLEGRPSMYDHPLSLDDNQSTLAEQPFPFDDDPPTLADQPLPLDDHSLIGGAQPSEEQSLKIKLHRGHVFEELNEAFQNNPAMKCPSMCLTIEMVLPNGIVEKGQDTGGIFRDALSEYWSTFKENCTTCFGVRVPVLRHDMKDVWATIAEVLVVGRRLCAYFPTYLAVPFLLYTLDAEAPLMEEMLLESYCNFVSEDDGVFIRNSLNNFSTYPQEEVEFFCEMHNVTRVVHANNWKETLLQVAHKEMIQEAAYIADCWRPVLQQSPLLKEVPTIQELITSLTPTGRKVMKLLKLASETDNASLKEQKVFGFVKQFINQLNPANLKKFLRFCTGADVTIVDEIK
ncbi:hypothetical protein CAPTEDRAFT_197984, partial [Capitella teleta]